MKKEDLDFHKKKAKESECNSEKMAKDLGLTKEELRKLAKQNKKH